MPIRKKHTEFKLNTSKSKTSYKKVMVGFGLWFLLLFVILVVFTKPAPPNSVQSGYEFADLGRRCSEAVSNYDKLSERLAVEDKKISETASSGSASLGSQASEYESSQNEAYRNAASDIYELYEQGAISYEEWSRRMDNLGAVPANITNSNRLSIQSRQEILNEGIRLLQNNKLRAEKIAESRRKVAACSEVASRQGAFQPMDVAELGPVIDSSTVMPQ